MRLPSLSARNMHRFFTAAKKSSALTAFRDPQAGTPGLLNVLQRVRLRGPPGHPLAGHAPCQAGAFAPS